MYKKGNTQALSSVQTVSWLESTGRTKPLRQGLAILDPSRPVPGFSAGRTKPLRQGLAIYPTGFSFSPNGKRLALTLVDGGNPDVWVYEWERDKLTRMTFEPGFEASPVILSTRSHGFPLEQFPLLNDYNYVVTRVRVEGQYYLLDASRPVDGFGQPPAPGSSSPVMLPPPSRLYAGAIG